MCSAPHVSGIVAFEYAVFQVSGDPWAWALSRTAPILVVTEINTFHGSWAVVIAGCFSVSVVETAHVIVVPAIDHHVHGFFFVTGSDTFGFVVAVTCRRPRVAIKAVRLSTVDVDGRPVGDGFSAAFFKPKDGRRFFQIVFVTTLVINDRNCASGACTEIVLHGRFDITSHGLDRNVLGFAIGTANLIKVPVVIAVQGSG